MKFDVINDGERGMGAGITRLKFENGFEIGGIINEEFWFSECNELVVCSRYDHPPTIFDPQLKIEVKSLGGGAIKEFIKFTRDHIKYNNGIGNLTITLNLDS